MLVLVVHNFLNDLEHWQFLKKMTSWINMLCDIYYIPPKDNLKLTDFYPQCSPLDQSNLLQVGKKTFKYRDSRFVCEMCNNLSIFINESVWGNICPKCFFIFTQGKRICNKCNKKLCCDCCGGQSKIMLYNNGLVLCPNLYCLSAFGFILKIDDMLCSCEQDAFNILTCKFDPFIKYEIIKYLNTDNWKYKIRGKYLLPDGSYSDPNRCLKEQLLERYSILSFLEWHYSENIICTC